MTKEIALNTKIAGRNAAVKIEVLTVGHDWTSYRAKTEQDALIANYCYRGAKMTTIEEAHDEKGGYILVVYRQAA